MNNEVRLLLEREPKHAIAWSKTLQTKDGERVCVLNLDTNSESYPLLCLIDYGTEIGCDIYTLAGEYDVGVSSGNSLIPI